VTEVSDAAADFEGPGAASVGFIAKYLRRQQEGATTATPAESSSRTIATSFAGIATAVGTAGFLLAAAVVMAAQRRSQWQREGYGGELSLETEESAAA